MEYLLFLIAFAKPARQQQTDGLRQAQIPLGSSRHVSTRNVRRQTCRTCCARRDERVEPCCSTSSTQPKCMGSTCRTHCVEKWRAKWNLGYMCYGSYRVDPQKALLSQLVSQKSAKDFTAGRLRNFAAKDHTACETLVRSCSLWIYTRTHTHTHTRTRDSDNDNGM